MLVLASDTTGKSLSVALVRDGRLVGETKLNLGYNHAVTHMPQVMNLLQSCEIGTGDIDLFACTNGPGSFTGTRIGISSFKAMAYAAGKPAVGVSTLETLAWPWRNWPQAIICPLLDARNGRIYGSAYTGSATAAEPLGLKPLIIPGNYLASDFLRDLEKTLQEQRLEGSNVLLVGDGADSVMEVQALPPVSEPQALPLRLVRLDKIHDAPSAGVVALLAEMLFATGADHDPFTLVPEYLTPSSAERKKAANR